MGWSLVKGDIGIFHRLYVEKTSCRYRQIPVNHDESFSLMICSTFAMLPFFSSLVSSSSFAKLVKQFIRDSMAVIKGISSSCSQVSLNSEPNERGSSLYLRLNSITV